MTVGRAVGGAASVAGYEVTVGPVEGNLRATGAEVETGSVDGYALISGAERADGYGTYAGAEHAAGRIAGARFIGFETGGHAWVGHDDEVMAAIRDVLVAHDQPPMPSARTGFGATR